MANRKPRAAVQPVQAAMAAGEATDGAAPSVATSAAGEGDGQSEGDANGAGATDGSAPNGGAEGDSQQSGDEQHVGEGQSNGDASGAGATGGEGSGELAIDASAGAGAGGNGTDEVNQGEVLMIKSTAKNGHRRAGIAFTREAQPVPKWWLSDDELAAIEADPRLVVTLAE